ncbi:MAG TPA: hypothetical protein PLL75_05810 [Candidatus Omnitrophota bacterium]|nr:hypothetical protein [Candidatus Omnitrophota bacterium]HPS37223.1 hypothetical protein [Candidatus Omnitrophota bacterium]
MKNIVAAFFAALLCLQFTGCNTVGEVLPPNDRVLIYPLAYDLTYLRTLEALDSQPGWVLEETDKEKGILSVRNTQYSRLDDSDQRLISFTIKRVDAGTTSVSILPKYQKVFGGDQFLRVIGDSLGREVKS